MILDGLFRRPRERRADPVNVTTLESVGMQNIVMGGETAAMKLAAVNRCLEVISDSVGKMPSYGMITSTRERVFPPVLDLLNLRPNEAMTPFIRRKMLELNRLIRGFAVEWILRDPITMEPVELIPVPSELVNFWQDTAGHVWYDITHPYNGAVMRLASTDVLHYKGYTRDGLHSLSVLQRASQVIGAGLDAQAYQGRYYSSGGQPSGVLSTEADLGGYVKDKAGKPTDVTRKDALRREWDRIHSGPDNAYRVAILDHGLTYTPLSATMADAKFVENHDITVIDICNFFGVPAYKVNAGKQSYSSNEQNAIEYVVGTLHPKVTAYEEELVYKLLPPSEARRYRVRMNMMAELRGDYDSRGTWYRVMREIGAYSVNDIRALEDLSDVEGGDDRYASLNYVPLAAWERLSENRNQGGDNNNTDTQRDSGRGR